MLSTAKTSLREVFARSKHPYSSHCLGQGFFDCADRVASNAICCAQNDSGLVMSTDDPPNKKNIWVQLGQYSQIAFIFPAATVVGWLIGVALDHWLHTTWLYIVGLILGIIAGFVELIRLVNSSDFE
jgi:Putative F0F1-ATPase subunit Ca2+/Mg2+ transporter